MWFRCCWGTNCNNKSSTCSSLLLIQKLKYQWLFSSYNYRLLSALQHNLGVHCLKWKQLGVLMADTCKEQGSSFYGMINVSVVVGTTWKCRGTVVHVQCTVRFTKFSDKNSDELVFALFELAAGGYSSVRLVDNLSNCYWKKCFLLQCCIQHCDLQKCNLYLKQGLPMFANWFSITFLRCANGCKDKSKSNFGKWSWSRKKTCLKWRILNTTVRAKSFGKQLGTRLLASFPPVCPSVRSPVISIGRIRSPLAVLCQGNVLYACGYNSRFRSFHGYEEHILFLSFSTMLGNFYWLLWLGNRATKFSCLVLFRAETEGVKTSCASNVSLLPT